MTMFTTQKDIQVWLDEHSIENYTVREDLSVDVQGDVDLTEHNLTFIPIQFNEVRGDFNCSDNQLISLQGSPKILIGSFDCSFNLITSIEFGPQIVGHYFYCQNNEINSLEFFLDQVGRLCSLEINSALGKFQDISDFSVLKAEHLRIRAIQERQQLDSVLDLSHRAQGQLFKL